MLTAYIVANIKILISINDTIFIQREHTTCIKGYKNYIEEYNNYREGYKNYIEGYKNHREGYDNNIEKFNGQNIHRIDAHQ